MNHLGVSALVNTHKASTTVSPVITNNINISQQNQDVAVKYPPETATTDINQLLSQISDLSASLEAMKIINDMFKNNPIYINKLLLVDDEKLAQLIKLLTNAQDVQIDCEDIGNGCTCGANTYRKVNAIYVIKDNKTMNLKYDFPNVTKSLKDLGINIKIVW